METSKTVQLQGFVKQQLEDAQKRFASFEEEAERVLKGLIERGREHGKELEELIQKLNVRDLSVFRKAKIRDLGRTAEEASSEVRRRLDSIQSRVIEAVGVATKAQIDDINRELSRLSKKLDGVVRKPRRKTSA